MYVYPHGTVGWLVSIMEGTGRHFTPAQILDTEARYPGLWNVINLELWQRQLIDDELKSK